MTTDINPDFAPAYNEYGIMALGRGDYDEALKLLKKAVALDTLYADAYYNMGGVLVNMGDYEEAATAFEQYLKHTEEPDDSTEVRTRIEILHAARK